VHAEAIGRQRQWRRHVVQPGGVELREGGVGIAPHLGHHARDAVGGEAHDGVAVGAGHAGGACRQGDQPGDVATGLSGDRADGQRDQLGVGVAGGAVGVGHLVEYAVDRGVGEVAGQADGGRQQEQSRRVRLIDRHGSEPVFRDVERQRADGGADEVERQPDEDVPVAVGDGQRAGSAELALRHEHVDGAQLHRADVVRIEAMEEGLEPQLVGPETATVDADHQGDALRQCREVNACSRDAADDVVVALPDRHEAEQRAPVVEHELVEDFFARVVDAGGGVDGESQANERRPTPDELAPIAVSPEPVRQARPLAGREHEDVVADLEHAVRGSEPGHGKGRHLPAGQDEMGVGGKGTHDLAQ
jgi:hypothetical protein